MTTRRAAIEAISALLGMALLSKSGGAAAALADQPRGFAIPRFRSEAGRRSAEVLGQRYLALFPEEADFSRLAMLLFGNDVEQRPENISWPILNARIRADFESSNTVTLDGWVLARSECRFCALAALLAF